MATGTAMNEQDPLDVPFKVVSNVTREEVYKACREMMGPHAPKPPDRPASVQRIRVHLGNRGSNDTIVKYRDAWLTENPCPSPAVEPAAATTAPPVQPEQPPQAAQQESKQSEPPEANTAQPDLTTALTLIRSEAAAEVERFKQYMVVLVDARTAQATSEARLAEREDAERRLHQERVVAHGRWIRGIVTASAVAVAIGLYVGWSAAHLSAAPGGEGASAITTRHLPMEVAPTPPVSIGQPPVDKTPLANDKAIETPKPPTQPSADKPIEAPKPSPMQPPADGPIDTPTPSPMQTPSPVDKPTAPQPPETSTSP